MMTKIKYLRIAVFIIASLGVAILILNLILSNALYNPNKDRLRHAEEVECLKTLTELGTFGTKISQASEIKKSWFGRYKESYILDKKGLVKVSYEGIKEENKFPYAQIFETLNMIYFHDRIDVKFNKKETSKYSDGTITYSQTGLRNSFYSNQMFQTSESSEDIIKLATNHSYLPHSLYLFACKNTLTIDEMIVNSMEWNTNILNTDKFAVQTSEDKNDQVLLISSQYNATGEQYLSQVLAKLDYLVQRENTVNKFINGGLFGVNFSFDF